MRKAPAAQSDTTDGAGAMDPEQPVRSIADGLSAYTGRGTVTLGEIADAFGAQSFLPMMVVPAMLVVTPLSGIPLFSSICGLTIAVVAAQMLVGRDRLWLPGFVVERQIEGEKARGAMKSVYRLADWLDEHSRRRFSPLLRLPMRKWIQAMCLICGLSMPFLELVPFSSSILGMAVLFFATSLITRDGLFVLFGVLTMGAALAVPLTVVGLV